MKKKTPQLRLFRNDPVERVIVVSRRSSAPFIHAPVGGRRRRIYRDDSFTATARAFEARRRERGGHRMKNFLSTEGSTLNSRIYLNLKSLKFFDASLQTGIPALSSGRRAEVRSISETDIVARLALCPPYFYDRREFRYFGSDEKNVAWQTSVAARELIRG